MASYQTFTLSDEPRIVGIPLTTGIPVFLCSALGLLTGYAYQLFLVGALFSIVMHVHFGGAGLRFFLSVLYWTLPRSLTYLVFRRFPNSADRQFIR